MAPGSEGSVATSAAHFSDPSLSVLARVLLSTDGTVVHLLEAWFDDPIGLAGHEQFATPVYPTDADLEPAGNETILRRRVLLQGRRTGHNYLYADTAIALDRLDDRVREDLLATSEPIGRVLRAHRVEIFREVLRSGRRPAGSLAEEFGIDRADELLYRVYRVVAGGRPIMMIAEHFPADLTHDRAGHPQPGLVIDLDDLDSDDQAATSARRS